MRLLSLFIIFARNALGCLTHPYITYRRLSTEKGDIYQTIFIFSLVILYFTFASLLRSGLNNPFLLTVKFNSLVLAYLVGFFGLIFMIFFFGRLTGGKGKLKSIFLLWSYTLLPTLSWFFLTSLIYLFLPPPRTLSILGKLFSVIYLTFSLAIFFWKVVLYYLTLRFGLRTNLFKISLITLFLTPYLLTYSILMYRLKVFRIPFI